MDSDIVSSENVSAVKDHYNSCTRWYRWFYYDKESLGMHYGFWDTPATTRKDALINQYRVLHDLLRPQSGDLILDAGCGVGGASLWLAAKTLATYIGITISETQVKLAYQYAKMRRMENRVLFRIGNYFETKFENEKFSKIFAIESFNYAYPNPKNLYSEMFRILKPGGTLVFSDGILLRRPESQEESKLADDFCHGFKMAGWNTPEEIIYFLKKAGFSKIRFINTSREIEKSVMDIWQRARRVSPLRIFKYLGLVTKTEEEQLLATESQKRMYEKGLFGHGVFVAAKP